MHRSPGLLLLAIGTSWALLTVENGADGYQHLTGAVTTQVGNITRTVLDLRIEAIGADGQPAIPGAGLQITWPVAGKTVLLTMSGADKLRLTGAVNGNDAFPCRPEPVAGTIDIARAAVGQSQNTLNTGIYCRRWDWAVICSSSAEKRFAYAKTVDSVNYFDVILTGSPLKISLVTSYFKENREGRVTETPAPVPNDKLTYYKPWEYAVRPRVPVGWISWRAYGADISEAKTKEITDFYANKGMRNFGMEYIILDDGWFYGNMGRGYAGYTISPPNVDWTRAEPGKFPDGLKYVIDYIHTKGFKAGIWISPFGFSGDPATHPTWWVKGPNDQFFINPDNQWHGKYYCDATEPEALTGWLLKGPTAYVDYGFDYIKVDGTLHVCYQTYRPCSTYFQAKGYTWAEACRKGYTEIRKTIGDRFYDQCWSRAPVTIGICDAIRVGQDVTGGWSGDLYQARLMYTWLYENNIVWIVDPDHLVMSGATEAEFRTMSTITSLTGCLLLYSDPPSQYPDPKLEIVKRVSPQVGYPAPRPGDLYKKTGDLPALWTLEIDRPFDHWMIVANTDFSAAKATVLNFKDIGLDTTKTYTVYDFWNRQYRGTATKTYACGAPAAHDVQVYALRQVRPYPWIVSTNRHISQGGIDLDSLKWNGSAKTLSGTSRVVEGDPYMVTLSVPQDYTMGAANFGATPATKGANNGATTIAFTPTSSGPVTWTVQFTGGTGVPPEKAQETVFPIAPLKAIAGKGTVRLTGSYNSEFRITVFSLSGKVLRRFSGRGLININLPTEQNGLVLIRMESGGRVEIAKVAVTR